MKADVPAEAARACPPVARPRGVRGERAGGEAPARGSYGGPP